MTDEPNGKPTRKLPERDDALNVPLAFEDAIRAALATDPPPARPIAKQGKARNGATALGDRASPQSDP